MRALTSLRRCALVLVAALASGAAMAQNAPQQNPQGVSRPDEAPEQNPNQSVRARPSTADVGQGLPNLGPQAEQLFALANQSRAANGAGQLKWDAALADAALYHCRRMAREGELSHRYGGEPDLTERAGHAGAHFSLIEENIALGSYVDRIHQGWLDSPGHRANMLNPQVNRVGIAVVRANGVDYAVADFSRAVDALTQAQVEAEVGALLHKKGLMILNDHDVARAYCASDNHYQGANPPRYLMRWQNADVDELPQPLMQQLVNNHYTRAEVGGCTPHDVEGAFTVYRVAVLLY